MKRGIFAAAGLSLFLWTSQAGALTPQQQAALDRQQQQWVQNAQANANQFMQRVLADQQVMMQKGAAQSLDQKWVDLTIQINDLMKDAQSKSQAWALVFPESDDYKAATKAAADAGAARDALRQRLLESMQNSDDYKNARQSLAADQELLDRLESSGGAPSPEAIQVADRIWAGQTRLNKLEQSVLGASPEWKAANDAVHAASVAFAALRDAQKTNPPADVQQVQSQIRDLTTERQKVDAQVQDLIKKISAVDSRAAADVSHERSGMLEEAQRMKDPVYAAKVEKQRQDVADYFAANPPHEPTPDEIYAKQQEEYNRQQREAQDQRDAYDHEQKQKAEAQRQQDLADSQARQQKEFEEQQERDRLQIQSEKEARNQAQRDYDRQQEEAARANQMQQ